jgi:hypothetical protein
VNPESAETSAMPRPITPAPTTAIVETAFESIRLPMDLVEEAAVNSGTRHAEGQVAFGTMPASLMRGLCSVLD